MNPSEVLRRAKNGIPAERRLSFFERWRIKKILRRAGWDFDRAIALAEAEE